MDRNYIDLIKERPELFRNSGEEGEIRILTGSEAIMSIEEELQKEIGILYEDDYIILLRDAVIFPDMSRGTYIRIIPREADGGVVILPVLEEKILLLRHYRHSLRRFVWEVPRGFGEAGLTAEENAVKELAEETGIIDPVLEYLGKVCPDSGTRSDQVSVFRVKLSPAYTFKSRDEKEGIDAYRLVSKRELRELVGSGDMIDGFTLSAVALACLKENTEDKDKYEQISLSF